MKQLKFMLAAATAVGIAAAAQADTSKLIDNENFENQEVGTLGRALTGWSYSDSANAEQDDDSKVELDGSNKALKVNTGTNPLLRHLNDEAGTAVDLTEDGFESLYIDTMVQFTVTPDGDTVSAGDDDKLMIYLKEVPAAGETPASTKLMVKALQFAPESAPGVGDGIQQVTDVEIDLGEKQILANEWYRLVVTAKAQDLGDGTYLPVFSITLDGTPLISGSVSLASDASYSNFPSIQGPVAKPTLTYVGFAGEGMVDDLTVATITTATSVDFTLLSFDLDAGVKSVTYTIGENSVTIEADTTEAIQVKHGTTVGISAEAKDWFTLGDYSTSYTASADDVEKTITVSSKEVTSDDIDVTVPTGTPAATVNAALAWAKAAGKTTAAVEGAANIVANYLLNVADLAVEPKIKITSIDLSGDVPTVTAEVTAADGTTTIKTLTADNINAAASIKYKAAATLEALKDATPKAAVEADDKFIQVVVE